MKNNPDDNIHLLDLVDTRNPDTVIEEIQKILSIIYPQSDTTFLKSCFYDIVKLFRGDYPGYLQCTTDYHDLTHTLDIFLVTARLMHGYIIKNYDLSENKFFLGLVSALMHDTGYITTIDEKKCTSEKYTLTHITRSIDFIEKYFKKHHFSQSDFNFCRNCISCTNINTDPEIINFSSPEEEVIGKILGISDLIGQMADRSYLEKLILLYIEFKEGNVQGLIDLLQQTVGFFEFTNKRFSEKLGSLDKNMIYHFIERWNIHEDLYKRAIDRNARYLQSVLRNVSPNLHLDLRRDGILDDLLEKGLFPRVN